MQYLRSGIIFLAAVSVACSLAQVPTFCPAIYSPVCGTDAKTYPSECFLKIAKAQDPDLQVAHYGKCLEIGGGIVKRESPENDYGCSRAMTVGICTLEFMPICSSDGTTSPNHCHFCRNYYAKKDSGVDITIKHYGKCTLDEFCPPMSKKGFCTKIYAPVCVNSNTYNTFCEWCVWLYGKQNAGEDVFYVHPTPGKCPEGHSVNTRTADFCLPRYKAGACSYEYEPVCGNDGNTYDNLCIFCYNQYQKEQNGKELLVEHAGECQSEVVEDEPSDFCLPHYNTGICTREFRGTPICGSDGKTHDNTCNFCYDRHLMEQNGEELTVAYYGECSEEAEDEVKCPPSYKQGICTLEYFPICGSDGHTYGNTCDFCIGRDHKKEEGGVLKLNHYGECH